MLTMLPSLSALIRGTKMGLSSPMARPNVFLGWFCCTVDITLRVVSLLCSTGEGVVVLREVIPKKMLLPFGHCPKVALTPPPLVLETFGVTFV